MAKSQRYFSNEFTLGSLEISRKVTGSDVIDEMLIVTERILANLTVLSSHGKDATLEMERPEL